MPGEAIVIPVDGIAVSQAADPSHMYVLRSGICQVYKDNKIVNEMHSGSILGNGAHLPFPSEISRNTVHIRSVGQCRVVKFARRDLEKVLGFDNFATGSALTHTVNAAQLSLRMAQNFPELASANIAISQRLERLCENMHIQRLQPGQRVIMKISAESTQQNSVTNASNTLKYESTGIVCFVDRGCLALVSGSGDTENPFLESELDTKTSASTKREDMIVDQRINQTQKGRVGMASYRADSKDSHKSRSITTPSTTENVQAQSATNMPAYSLYAVDMLTALTKGTGNMIDELPAAVDQHSNVDSIHYSLSLLTSPYALAFTQAMFSIRSTAAVEDYDSPSRPSELLHQLAACRSRSRRREEAEDIHSMPQQRPAAAESKGDEDVKRKLLSREPPTAASDSAQAIATAITTARKVKSTNMDAHSNSSSLNQSMEKKYYKTFESRREERSESNCNADDLAVAEPLSELCVVQTEEVQRFYHDFDVSQSQLHKSVEKEENAATAARLAASEVMYNGGRGSEQPFYLTPFQLSQQQRQEYRESRIFSETALLGDTTSMQDPIAEVAVSACLVDYLSYREDQRLQQLDSLIWSSILDNQQKSRQRASDGTTKKSRSAAVALTRHRVSKKRSGVPPHLHQTMPATFAASLVANISNTGIWLLRMLGLPATAESHTHSAPLESSAFRATESRESGEMTSKSPPNQFWSTAGDRVERFIRPNEFVTWRRDSYQNQANIRLDTKATKKAEDREKTQISQQAQFYARGHTTVILMSHDTFASFIDLLNEASSEHIKDY